MNIIKKIRPRKMMAVGAFGALGLGFMPMQCAPQTCAEKPGSAECTPPYTVGVGDDGYGWPTGGKAIAGKQFLQEINQTLLAVALVCQGDYHWTIAGWVNADNESGPTVQASWSCWPRRAAAISYVTQHS